MVSFETFLLDKLHALYCYFNDLLIIRVVKFDNDAISDGIDPVISLLSKTRISKFFKFPISVGIVPSKLLFSMRFKSHEKRKNHVK
jgi:hypothetical protein